MLSGDARNEWMTIIAVGALLALAAALTAPWWVLVLVVAATTALVLFFRDPHRRIPTQRNAVVAPGDGRISSIHRVEHFEPFDGPARCIRIFLSVFDVHVTRSPCHGEVQAIERKAGEYRNALNPESAEVNASVLLVLAHPIRGEPIAAVRQVAGMLARTIVCRPRQGQVLQRGERIGIIKLGSTAELYLPDGPGLELAVQQGQRVYAGQSVVAMLHLSAGREGEADAAEAADTPEAPDTELRQADTQRA